MNNDDVLYSVVLLKESIIDYYKSMNKTKIYEESIILLRLKQDFFENKSLPKNIPEDKFERDGYIIAKKCFLNYHNKI